MEKIHTRMNSVFLTFIQDLQYYDLDRLEFRRGRDYTSAPVTDHQFLIQVSLCCSSQDLKFTSYTSAPCGLLLIPKNLFLSSYILPWKMTRDSGHSAKRGWNWSNVKKEFVCTFLGPIWGPTSVTKPSPNLATPLLTGES